MREANRMISNVFRAATGKEPKDYSNNDKVSDIHVEIEINKMIKLYDNI